MDGLSLAGFGMVGLFIVGYVLITVEHVTHVSKSTIALMMGVLLWTLEFVLSGIDCAQGLLCLGEHIATISQVILFLLAALAVVEIINSHKGFSIIVDLIHTRSKRKLLWIVGFITFFLSSVLDNLTTTIVMVSLLKKIIPGHKDRLLIGGAVVIAANAGGCWTPIGDVTTTMLWIGGQLTTVSMMQTLFLPSIGCFLAALIPIHLALHGDMAPKEKQSFEHSEPFGNLIFFCGIGLLIFVPIFKMLTGLPPFMGMLFALSVLWIITDIAHHKYETRNHLRVTHALTKIDVSAVLFFLGILLSVDALNTANILSRLAAWLDSAIANPTLIAIAIGLASAIVDNVPLVAAAMGMYPMEQFPVDHSFWQLIAYCAGTGGSILVIGSAAGVVYMGLENVNFFWYMRRIGVAAFIGYFVGIGVYLLQ